MTRSVRSIHDLMSGRQHNRIMRLTFPDNDGPSSLLLVNRLEATESLSKDFEFRVELLSDDAQIPLKTVIGKLLVIALVRTDGTLRHFSGHVHSFCRRRADGAITVYEATLVPWMRFLALRNDNYLFHHKTLREQTESIFQDYGIHPRWDWRVTGDDKVMTDACQFGESDFNYLSRRWETAGWYYWYEHDEKGHTLIVGSDSTRAPAIDGGTSVRFHAGGGSEEEDAIDTWSPVRQMTPSSVALQSFNFKNPVPVGVNVPTLNRQWSVPEIESYEFTGAYGFKHIRDGDAQSRIRMEEIETTAKHIEAEGNNRCLMPGRWFRLIDHFNHFSNAHNSRSENDEFLILSIRHKIANNYLQGDDLQVSYRNLVTCTRKSVPWRPGRNFNSRHIEITAPQTATVVGPAGTDGIFTDEFGRIRVQFHWDRCGVNDDRSSAWLRVNRAWTGADLGLSALPRIGTEVIVQWLSGNPDRPIVTGAVSNSWNLPPWILPAQRALSGMRSRELVPNQGNALARRGNHLILDDTHGHIQAQLKSDHACSQLSLGYICRIEDATGRKDIRGEGWELATDAWGVARAGRGMLLTTEARPSATGRVTSMNETIQRLTFAQELQESQSAVAAQHDAQQSNNHQTQVATALKAQVDAIQGASFTSDKKSSSELVEPHLILSSPAGIETTTAQSTHIASDLHTAISAGKSIAVAAGDGFFASVRQTFRLFVHKAGMKLIAAGGDVDLKALTNSMNLFAKLDITLTGNRIVISAKQDIVINGGGSYAKFSASGIEHGTTGTFIAHAASHHFMAAKGMTAPDLKSDVADVSIKRDLHLEYVDADGNPLQHDPIQAQTWDGQTHDTTLDATGKTIINNVSRGSFRAEQTNRK